MSYSDKLHRTQALIDYLDDADMARSQLRALIETPRGPWAGLTDPEIVFACRAGYQYGTEGRAR